MNNEEKKERAKKAVSLLPDRSYLVDFGPVTMVVKVMRDDVPVPDLEFFIYDTIYQQLEETTRYLPILRNTDCYDKSKQSQYDAIAKDTVPGKMVAAVMNCNDPELTPMAAVAGAMSDYLVERLAEMGATKIFVNNGGDVALRLAPHESLTVAVLHDMHHDGRRSILRITGEDGIGGIATSGVGGRSLTLGIANGVTVLGKTGAEVDALATSLANKSFLPLPGVERRLASEIDPTTDIGHLEVVTAVPLLSKDDAMRSAAQVAEAAVPFLNNGTLRGISIAVQDIIELHPHDFFTTHMVER
ncbi:MAG: hypothetical protein ACOYCB_03970 [Fastidiosipilaceae bacterium]|nr:hypothetical protein [Clostridiaceae bacterium]